MTPSFLPHTVERAILRIFDDLATPTSLKASLLWKYGEWDQLASMELEPKHYLEAHSYWLDATAVSLVRKLENLPTSFDRKGVAEDNFLASELQCFRSNRRLLPYLSPGLPDTDVGVLSFVKKARKICKDILGPVPDTDETFENPFTGQVGYKVSGRFGPGATFGDRGRLTTVPDKMSSEPTITTGAMLYLFPWYDTLWASACRISGKDPLYVRGNRFTTVPKDCKKDRGIAIEPSINLFYQLGYGRVIRNRLRVSGLDLTKGQDIHKRVACEASIEGHLCTLDLSNASDTVCFNLVKLLLPDDWFSVLRDLRSSHTLFRKDWRLLEKFSSMGNGFTFELETLIFLCLAMALPSDQKLEIGRNVYVFGDDIIIPSNCSKAMIAVLSFLGLSINEGKSFIDGPFRESCGGDYFLGVDVRPFFLKDSPNEPQQLISFANGLKRSSNEDPRRFAALRRGWFGVLDGLPSHIRSLRGPKDLGDLCIHDEESSWRCRQRSGIRYIKVYRPAKYRKVSWRNFRPDVTLASAVYGVPSGSRKVDSQNGGIIPRNAVSGYKVGWVARS